MRRFLIYGLIDPISKELRYVGMSTTGIKRPRAHFDNKREIDKISYKSNWIRGLKQIGLNPEIIILDEWDDIDHSTLYFWEQWHISYYRGMGVRLTNLADGGPGPFGCVSPKRKPVLRSDGKLFSSRSEAAKFMKICHASSISEAITKKTLLKGFAFKEFNGVIESWEAKARYNKIIRNDGIVFDSIRAASVAICGNRSGDIPISNILKNKRTQPYKGYMFKVYK